jgi:O-antigen/teichoic acid export membrane protein
VGVSLAEIATRLPSAMSSAIQAQAARVSHESALDLSGRAIRLTVLCAVPVLVALGLVVNWLIPMLFGEAFRGAVGVFYLLAPGALANALILPISSYLGARGHVYWGVSVVSVGLNIALNLALITPFGYLGAALASSVSYAFLVTMLVVRLRAMTGMGPRFFLVPTLEDCRVIINSARAYLRAT